jgi:DNA-binding GntR family transcriptional regulator
MAEAKPKTESKPARRGGAIDGVYERIRKKVLDSELAPGSQILEQELAVMLGVSRTPVREAVIRLHNEGLLEIIPRHGVRIVPIAVSDMREIYDVLISLEPRAAELLAARGASAKELRQLEACCERMTDALARDEMEAWALADEEFHLGIVRLSGNRRLADIVLNCWDQVHRARYFTLRLRKHPHPSKSIEEHYEIIEAIRRGDAKAASDIYRRHRDRGLKEQVDVMMAFRIHQI